MPVLLARASSESLLQPTMEGTLAAREADGLDIALVNNMPDTALESTERQFTALLEAAARDTVVRLHLFSIAEVPRSEAARAHLARSYSDVTEMWNAHLDGIIVTGTEPRTQSLCDEPYWAALAKLVDWAETNGIASVWSCLAAHAAVLHRDGVARSPLPDKCFGLFDCTRAVDHALTAGLPTRVRVAHSRWNELPEAALWAARYTVLTRSPVAGVDMFAKQGRSLALFFQGHPEYDGRALLREYRRDVGRYLRGERDTYPPLPLGYFDHAAATALSVFHGRAIRERHEDLIASFPDVTVSESSAPAPGSPAARVYANWLAHVAVQKAQKQSGTAAAMTPDRFVTATAAAEDVR
jgi:homoserine O-succinyltransferase/O-acetyltransferase